MFTIQLINTVRTWEKRIEVEGQQRESKLKGRYQPEGNHVSTREKPVREHDQKIFHTSMVNVVQLWEKRWQAEEDQRQQRVRKADTIHETILRRLPRLLMDHAKGTPEVNEFCSCCQSQMDTHDLLHS